MQITSTKTPTVWCNHELHVTGRFWWFLLAMVVITLIFITLSLSFLGDMVYGLNVALNASLSVGTPITWHAGYHTFRSCSLVTFHTNFWYFTFPPAY